MNDYIDALAAEQARRNGRPRDSWDRLDLRPYLDGRHIPATPSMLYRTDGRGLLYPGKVNELHGESESGKSMVAQHLAAELLGEGHTAVMLDYESDALSVIDRLRSLQATDEAIADRFHYLQPEEPARGAKWDRVLAEMRDLRPSLIVVDGVNAALSIDSVKQNDNDDVNGWVTRVTAPLERTGATVLLIDHVTKTTEGRGRFAIGAQSKLGRLSGASYLVDVETPLARGRVGRLKLYIAKDRPGGVRAHCGKPRADRTQLAARIMFDSTISGLISVSIDPPQAEVPGGPAGWRPTQVMERISVLLESSPQPMTVSEIKAAKVSGGNDHRVQALRLLLAEGYVELTRQAATKYYRSVRPYRAAEDPGSGADDDDETEA